MYCFKNIGCLELSESLNQEEQNLVVQSPKTQDDRPSMKLVFHRASKLQMRPPTRGLKQNKLARTSTKQLRFNQRIPVSSDPVSVRSPVSPPIY